jgi:hypothetical protein
MTVPTGEDRPVRRSVLDGGSCVYGYKCKLLTEEELIFYVHEILLKDLPLQLLKQ